jgi:hypothetical protein
MKIFKPAVATFFLAALFFTLQVVAQDNPNCPDASSTDIDYCDSKYYADMYDNQASLDYDINECTYEYEVLVSETVQIYEEGRISLEEYRAELEYWSNDLMDCEEESWNEWVDDNMEAADDWNGCLCTYAECDYYCNL